MTHSTDKVQFKYNVGEAPVELTRGVAEALASDGVGHILDIDQLQQDGAQEPIEVDAEGNKFVRLEPNWRNTLRYFANAHVWHNFEQGKVEPMISLIEQVRYLALKQPDDLEAVLEELRGQAGSPW